MELSTWSPTGKRPKPPPLWLVTNGDVTVGPVNTALLVRGVVDGRIWDGFYVRDTRTQAWRPVHEVREVRSVNERLYRRHLPLAPRDAASLEALMMLTEDPREVLSLGLDLAMMRVRADMGLVHCYDDPMRAPVTRFGAGVADMNAMGDRVWAHDPLLKIAKARCIALGDPQLIPELRLGACRLGGSVDQVRGVAMVPIACARGVIGTIELGRSDHPFRATDAVVLREVMGKLVARLESLPTRS